MLNKLLYIIILSLFVLSTSTAYALSACTCYKDNNNTTQLEMPCHEMAGLEKQDKADNTNDCCKECACYSISSAKIFTYYKSEQAPLDVTFISYDFAFQYLNHSTFLNNISKPPIYS